MNKNGNIDLLIVIPPARNPKGLWLPFGALYVAGALRRKGYNPILLNVDKERLTNAEVVDRITGLDPKYVGYSGMVATSYKYIKDLSFEVRKALPGKIQILGGGLSCAAEVILNNTAIDIVVSGEGDVTAVELLDNLGKGTGLGGVKGIYYKDGSRCTFTGRRPLIMNLDDIPYPPFDMVDINRYFADGLEFIKDFTGEKLDRRIYDRKRSRRFLNIIVNRGCVGNCSFCVRPDPGLRMHSIKYVFDYIEYCIEKLGVGFFSFGDECFAPNVKRNWEFIEEYKRRKLDIVFRILGMRVDTIDRDVLKAYKEIGCWLIEYGIESGSQKMLNIIDKKVAVAKNREAILWTREAGIISPPQLILAMPGETDRTIGQTLDFIKSVSHGFKQVKCTYALPIPGAPLYDYARLTGAIEDEDGYLSSLSEIEGTQAIHANVTDEDDRTVISWKGRIKKELDDHYIFHKYKVSGPLISRCLFIYESLKMHLRDKSLWSSIRRRLLLLFFTITGSGQKKVDTEQKNVRYRKRRDISIEDFIAESDCLSVNTNISLKNINGKIKEKNNNVVRAV